MKIFNINHPVIITLTEEGINILKRYEEERLNWIKDNYKGNSYLEEFINNEKLSFPKIGKDGSCEMALRDIMELFGNYMHPNQEPFSFYFAISEEYLEEQKTPKKAK